ncbi:hypothetical protein C9006_17440 [Escherichia coli]|nr:hypothetical protein C9006_17440 [Escherichia coli]
MEARSKSRLNKTYTKNIDLRHIFALYRKLATVKEVLLLRHSLVRAWSLSPPFCRPYSILACCASA